MNKQDVVTFFLACDCKPGTPTFSVLDPFAYDVTPAFIYGTLGTLHYDPPIYSVIDLYADADPLFGYVCTISHPDTIALLDKIKGFHGPDGVNFHQRILIKAFTDPESNPVDAWVYVISDKILDCYESLEQIEFGIWDDDNKLLELLNAIVPEKLDEELD